MGISHSISMTYKVQAPSMPNEYEISGLNVATEKRSADQHWPKPHQLPAGLLLVTPQCSSQAYVTGFAYVHYSEIW